MAIRVISDLPEDLVPEILVRLPVKSLLRLKCVCKSLYTLITNPCFIRKHLNYASLDGDNTGIALVRWNEGISKIIVGLLSNQVAEVFHDVVMPFLVNGNFYVNENLYERKFYGPCDGIICVFGFRTRYYNYNQGVLALWNPATRQFKELSFPEVLPYTEDVGLFGDEFGFGLDQKNCDYKVVRIRYFMSKSSPLIEVYNLTSDSWRKIDAVVPNNLRCHMDSSSTYLNGFYYWWACDENGMFVLSFDFADEVFERITPPDLYNTDKNIYKNDRTVFQFKESIAVAIAELGDGFAEDVVVWVLNRDGNRKTWIKQFTVHGRFSSAVLGFLRSGEAIIRDVVGCLRSYDPSTKQYRVRQDFRNDIHSYTDIELQIVIYVESLVPLKGAYELVY